MKIKLKVKVWIKHVSNEHYWRACASLAIVKFRLLWGLLIRNLDGFGNGQKPRKWYHRYFNFVAFMAYIKKIGPDIVGIFKLPFQQNNVKLYEFYISRESKRVFRLFVYSIIQIMICLFFHLIKIDTIFTRTQFINKMPENIWERLL